MTVAEANITISGVWEQGWTKEQIEEWLTDQLAALQIVERNIVEFSINSVKTNSDPFGLPSTWPTNPSWQNPAQVQTRAATFLGPFLGQEENRYPGGLR
jgi:hypothetical protein